MRDRVEAPRPRYCCFDGGGKRDRTADLLHAMQALSQLSYTPTKGAHYTGRISLCKEWERAFSAAKRKRPFVTERASSSFQPPCPRVAGRGGFKSGGQLIAQRQVADALAGCCEDCVDECRSERR